jgi:hypothetical protein
MASVMILSHGDEREVVASWESLWDDRHSFPARFESRKCGAAVTHCRDDEKEQAMA